jgi:hypothetical protein
MASNEVTSPCSIWDTRAVLTAMAAAICFWPRPSCLRVWASWCPRAWASNWRAPAAISPGDPGGVQFALQVFPVQGGALRHVGLLLCFGGVVQVQLLGDEMFSLYHRFQFPDLSPPTSNSAEQAGSNAKSTRISDLAAEPGRSSLR